MKLRPLGQHVIVQPIEDDVEKSPGGIIIPDTAKEKPQKGKVIAVGKGKILKDGKRVPLEVMEGDMVLFGKYSGEEVKIKGEKYLILEEDDILAIIS